MEKGKRRWPDEQRARPHGAVRWMRKLRLFFGPRWMREYHKFEQDERGRRRGGDTGRMD